MRNSLGVALRELTKQKPVKHVFARETTHEITQVCECFVKGKNTLTYNQDTGEYKTQGPYCNTSLLCVHIMKSKHQAKIKAKIELTPPKHVTYQASIHHFINEKQGITLHNEEATSQT